MNPIVAQRQLLREILDEVLQFQPQARYESLYQLLGDRQVKNIADPVRVYRVLPDPATIAGARRARQPLIITVLGVVLLAAMGGALWYAVVQQGSRVAGKALSSINRCW